MGDNLLAVLQREGGGGHKRFLILYFLVIMKRGITRFEVVVLMRVLKVIAMVIGVSKNVQFYNFF